MYIFNKGLAIFTILIFNFSRWHSFSGVFSFPDNFAESPGFFSTHTHTHTLSLCHTHTHHSQAQPLGRWRHQHPSHVQRRLHLPLPSPDVAKASSPLILFDFIHAKGHLWFSKWRRWWLQPVSRQDTKSMVVPGREEGLGEGRGGAREGKSSGGGAGCAF